MKLSSHSGCSSSDMDAGHRVSSSLDFALEAKALDSLATTS